MRQGGKLLGAVNFQLERFVPRTIAMKWRVSLEFLSASDRLSQVF
jgi:hypothetical protein